MQTASNSEKQSDQRFTKSGASSESSGAVLSTLSSGLRNIDVQEIKSAATDISHRVRDASTDLYKRSVNVVNQYPLASAMGMAAVGFLAGVATEKFRSR